MGDLQTSEQQVDAILIRSNSPNVDALAKLFALKMKAFFHSLKGEFKEKEEILGKLRHLTQQPDCSYSDL